MYNHTVRKGGDAVRRKQMVGLILAGIVLVAMFFVPEAEGLSRAGIHTIGMLLAFLILLIAESLPLTLTSFIILGLMPVLGVSVSFTDALSGFSNQVVFFTLASFGIAAAFTTTPLSRRILSALLSRFGNNIRSLLFALMLCNALVSSVVSNVPTCAIFMAIGLNLIEMYDDPAEKKRAARATMIAVSVATMVGGMMTPAGSSINLLAIGLLEEFAGRSIPFVLWMAAGVPLALAALPVAWWLIVRIHRPPEIDRSMVNRFIAGLDVPAHVTTAEVKVICITGAMLVLWILSSWFSQINVMVVGVLGTCLLCFPGIDTPKFSVFIKSISWDCFFLMGALLSLGAAMVSNGVSDWIISLMPALSLPLPLLIAFVTALLMLLLVIIPVAPSLVTIMATPMIAIATGAGVAPELTMLACGLFANDCFLLPLDTVTLLTYGTGHYSMLDMVKSSLPLQLVLIVLMSLWIPVVGKIFGL